MKASVLEGRVVGLISPGWGVTQATVDSFSKLIASFGAETKLFGSPVEHDKVLAGSDSERANNLMAACSDPQVDYVLCARGGYGCTRIIDYLKVPDLQQKPIIGYSDATSLLMHLHSRDFREVFHGPMMSDLILRNRPESLQWLLEVLTGARRGYDLPPTEYKCLKGGSIEGILLGGNLTVLESLIGTGSLKLPNEYILLIEEYGENYWSIDRSLVHLKQAGVLRGARGLLIGSMEFTGDRSSREPGTVCPQDMLLDHFSGFQGPIAYGLPFGHCDKQMTIPLGSSASLCVDDARLSLQFGADQYLGSK